MRTPAELGLRPPANRVDPRAVWFWTARALLGWVAPLGAASLILLIAADHSGPWRYWVLAGAGLLAVLHIVVMPQWRYRVHRYEVTPTAVYTLSGWLTQEARIAPLSRIQTVDSERGPVEQVFRLANVTVTTASAAGPLRIRGLDRAIAQQLVVDLTARTEHVAGDAT